MVDIFYFAFFFFALFFGFMFGYMYFNIRKSNDDLSYNVLTIREDLVNVQIKLERVLELATVRNG
jgi:hypothetical protein